MKEKPLFSMKDLQDFEELEILGGGAEINSVIQNGCQNVVAGCAGCTVQEGCPVQEGCTNNVPGCADSRPPKPVDPPKPPKDGNDN